MNTLPDFVEWAGSQQQAASLLGIDPSLMSRYLSGKRPVSAKVAMLVEQVSNGLYRADDLLPATEFLRDADGQITGYHVRLDEQAA